MLICMNVKWSVMGGGGGEEGGIISYPDPNLRSCWWITSPLWEKCFFSHSGDVIHQQLRKFGSGYETRGRGVTRLFIKLSHLMLCDVDIYQSKPI